jgi:immune inhibitor A
MLNILRVIIVLAEFQDYKIAPGTKTRMEDLWFSTGRKVVTGSVNEYYQEVSNGAISLSGEVVGPFTLPEKMSYYANNKAGRDWPEPNSQTMAKDTFEACKSSINFKPYDNDGNGYVDAFIIVHAGRDSAETGDVKDIWSVKWILDLGTGA